MIVAILLAVWLVCFALLVLGLVGCLFIVVYRYFQHRPVNISNVASRPLLTGAEHRFLLVLVDALPRCLVCLRVPMGALLKVDDGLDPNQFQAMRYWFSQKIVGYAIIDPDSGSVVVLVELDDSSHNLERDRFRDAILNRAGYRIERFPNRPFPDVPAVRQRLVFQAVEDQS